MRLVYGVGINGKKGYKKTREYNLWLNMLARCYSDKFHLRQPTYIGCSVSDNFKSFSYFYDWCQNQVGFKDSGWHLDKDILVKNNKLYSEDLCVFVPEEINKLLERRGRMRGDLPIGVSFHKLANKFRVDIGISGKKVYLGLFECKYDAFSTYKKKKESHIVDMANKYIHDIDKRAYKALIGYRIDITD